MACDYINGLCDFIFFSGSAEPIWPLDPPAKPEGRMLFNPLGPYSGRDGHLDQSEAYDIS